MMSILEKPKLWRELDSKLSKSGVSPITIMVTMQWCFLRMTFHVLVHVIQLQAWSTQPHHLPEKVPKGHRLQIITTVRYMLCKMWVVHMLLKMSLVIVPYPLVKPPTHRAPTHVVP